MKSNIWKIYLLSITQSAIIVAPVLIPFYASHSIGLQQFFLLQGVFTFTWVLTDIPTGYLADRWGRKNTIFLGCLFDLVGVIAYAFATNFWQFALVQIFMALGLSLHSGAMEAMIYDTLVELKEAAKSRKIFSRQFTISVLSTGLTGILGGFIAQYSLHGTVLAMIPFFFIGLLLSLSLTEPRRHKTLETKYFGAMWKIFKETVVQNRVLRSVIFLFGILGAMTFSLVWFAQPYQIALQIPLYLFGIVNAAFMVTMALTSQYAHHLEKFVDDRILLIILSGIVITSFLLLGLPISWLGLVILLIGRSTYAAFLPLTTDIINRVTISERRATVLSIKSFAYNLIFSIASPFIGLLAGIYTLNTAILLTGLSGGVIVMIGIFIIISSWKSANL